MALTQKPLERSWLTVFTGRSSRHSRVVHWIISRDLLRNQSHYCIIRYLKKQNKTDNIYANDCFKPNAQFKRFCFLVVSKFLTQPFRKLIDHAVDVIFYVLLHLFWCLTDKQNIWFPLCAQSSLHIYMMIDMGEGEVFMKVQKTKQTSAVCIHVGLDVSVEEKKWTSYLRPPTSPISQTGFN